MQRTICREINSGNMHAMKQQNTFTSWLFDIRVIHHYAGYIQIYFVCPILSLSTLNKVASFSLKFLSFCVHISGSIELIALTWVSLQRYFPPTEFESR